MSEQKNEINIASIREMKCCETEGCEGILQRSVYAEQNGIKSAQFKCDKCYKYVQYIDGKFYSAGKYNCMPITLEYRDNLNKKLIK